MCRADVTPKLGYQYINVLRDQQKFDKLATVINSIDLNSRKSSYGYKYGYGYGHKYGYGYVWLKHVEKRTDFFCKLI